MTRRRRPVLAIPMAASLLALAPSPPASAQPSGEQLAVLDGWVGFFDAENSLYRTLLQQARARHAERVARIAALESAACWRARQQWVAEQLDEMWGPFPERTPLEARVVEVLERDGYRVEKVIYQSLPGFYVTAALFVPDGLSGPAPGILYSSGHTEPAFRSPQYQQVILNLVAKGFVVLAFDPVSQGERLQYHDPATGVSRVGPASREHSYAGAQALLAGIPIQRYMVWDGIRSLDYLLTRSEVDPDRIGATGRSGGGTQTGMIAAIDDRIHASAPEAWFTPLIRVLEKIGPQDAEQIIPGAFPAGFDLADLITVRAPRPGLIVATTRDIFSIDGTRALHREARRAYAALGAASSIGLAEADQIHATVRENREAVYDFFQKALGRPGSPRDDAVDMIDPVELRITPTGQVATSLGGRTVFDLVQDELAPGLAALRASRGDPDALAGRVEAARARSGYAAPEPARPVFTGRYPLAGYAVEQYFLEAPGYPLPLLVFLPDGPGPHPTLVYLDPDGKQTHAGPGGRFEELVRRGYAVVAPDLIGMGELGPGDFEGHSYEFRVGRGSYAIWYMALLQGRSLVGLRAADVARVVDFLRGRDDVDAGRLTLLAERGLATVGLHAASFDGAFARVVLVEPLLSYAELATRRYYDPGLVHETVAGALPAYDLPDLVAALAPRPVLMVDPRDALARPASPGSVAAAYEPAGDALRVDYTGLWEDAWEGILGWLDETALGPAPPLAATEVAPVTVFESGTAGYEVFRIPALVRAAGGDLLAFCEARQGGDASEIDLVMKRSSDGGRSWGPLQVVQESDHFRALFDAEDTPAITVGNPAPVVDPLDPEHPGRIWLPFTLENDRVFVTFSDDDGETWSQRREITRDVKRPEWGWYATGPGHSIQIHSGPHRGRLIVPTDHRLGDDGEDRGAKGAHVVLSDDHGRTWRLGAVDDSYEDGLDANETTVVELQDGALYFNTRDQDGAAPGTRGEAWSHDGGETFSSGDPGWRAFRPAPPVLDPPVVQAALLRLCGDLILFSGPDQNGPTGEGRSDMRIRYSTDEALTWQDGPLLHTGPAAYSDMAAIGRCRAGILFEAGDPGQKDPYQRIVFLEVRSDAVEP